ncbi:hypothetical protein GT204_08395 [Streptomyces sp. SID4919]|uniref:hypothetical protein n=1 Tax=unclassified Streptomyces TaxID=2593676 RepID=UPI000C08AAD5|nr:MULTISPECIES: hypothetical protein [unclassified Streptomyces]MYY08917.1 hypothetical protein [Streptomyces sp. SID4919]
MQSLDRPALRDEGQCHHPGDGDGGEELVRVPVLRVAQELQGPVEGGHTVGPVPVAVPVEVFQQ